MVKSMVYGIMIILQLKGLDENQQRLLRKKRHQIMKKTNLVRVTNGVYLFPFEKRIPTDEEFFGFQRIWELLNELDVEARYFATTEVKPELAATTHSKKNRVFGQGYFLVRPFKRELWIHRKNQTDTTDIEPLDSD
jgi:hypothetical protein